MKPDRFDQTLHAAIAAGLLPATATRPAHDTRPWPVVLLTALGAWLAAVPLLGVVGLLLGDLISRGVGPYFIGTLVLAGAVVVLRSREVPLFIEQLAVPGLLVGGGALGFGLFRDLPAQAAAAVLALVAAGLAVALRQAWLRVLLGATSAVLTTIACAPRRWFDMPSSGIESFWLAWHASFVLWVLWQVLQQRLFDDGRHARHAATLESFAAGWLLATLAGLAWWSGMSFLVGASLGGNLVGEVAREVAMQRRLVWQWPALQTVSAGLTVVAALWGARQWPVLRQPWLAGVALVLVALAWFLPALGAVWVALAWGATSQRWRQAAAAALAAAWIIGSFYYQLQWPLATKALVLVLAGLVLGVLAWWAQQRGTQAAAVSQQQPAPSTTRAARAGIGLCAAAVLAVANIGIWQKEDLIAHGQPVYVELAPVDPRSLMQGDYMQLNFRVPGDMQGALDALVTLQRPHVVAQRDARGVATLRRIDNGTPLAADELRIELTPKGGRWIFVSDAWFFREGEAERWAAARYGEFRVSPDGKALLVGMADAQLKAIRP
jgi:uncharacterized membrane-anchored protein